jgi:hypothetical protein
MRNRMIRSAVAGLLCAAGFAAGAHATDFSINTSVPGGYAWVIDPPGYLVGTIHDANTNTNEGAYIGTIDLTGVLVNNPDAGLTSLHVFCIDIHDNLGGGTFTEASIADLENVTSNVNVHYSAQQVTDLTKFLAYVDVQGVTNAITSAAAQLGVWEIISEANHNNWNVTDSSSSFWVGGLDPSVTSLANTWLANSQGQSTIGYTLHVLDPLAGNQTQAFITHVPGDQTTLGVPEPATWGMIVVGFGLLGSALRRRKPDELFA